jgi:thioredoxin 1
VTPDPVAVTDADWDSRVLGGGAVLVDFWAPWCAPCRKIEPIVRDLAARYAGRLRVARLDVDAEPRAAARYEVLSLPTLILFRDGEPVERVAGAVRADRLERAVAAHLDPPED